MVGFPRCGLPTFRQGDERDMRATKEAMNRRIVLKRRPVGAPRPDDFGLIESPVSSPADGQILCRTIYLSLDPSMRGRISCPNGVDVYFDNVGGDILKSVLGLVNPHARVPLCGLISQYNATEPPPGPNWGVLLVNRVMVKGFIISDHLDRMPEFLRECTAWVREGRLRYREDVVVGLENAPAAFIGLLDGKNFGKLMVKVGEDPTR